MTDRVITELRVYSSLCSKYFKPRRADLSKHSRWENNITLSAGRTGLLQNVLSSCSATMKDAPGGRCHTTVVTELGRVNYGSRTRGSVITPRALTVSTKVVPAVPPEVSRE